MSRYQETTQLLISDDASNTPQFIRLNEQISDTDITTLTQVVVASPATYPVGTTSVNMGQIVAGLWLYVKPAADIQLQLSGGAPITFKGGKSSKMWVSFTSLTVVNPSTAPISMTLVIGG